MSNTLNTEAIELLVGKLKSRFEKNMNRHKSMNWSQVEPRLRVSVEKLWSLNQMEESGGEPDVVGFDQKTGEYTFYDCSLQTPSGRRNLCYDKEALDARKSFKPKDSAVNVAKSMGIELLTEEEYRKLQEVGNFDTKTSSWVETPSEIRKLGGAMFCDNRYQHTFTYHNGADSYYASRGFRGKLVV